MRGRYKETVGQRELNKRRWEEEGYYRCIVRERKEVGKCSIESLEEERIRKVERDSLKRSGRNSWVE